MQPCCILSLFKFPEERSIKNCLHIIDGLLRTWNGVVAYNCTITVGKTFHVCFLDSLRKRVMCVVTAQEGTMGREREAKGASWGQMMGKKDTRRKRSGKIVRRKRQNETHGITAKEISSVNGDNPYPGSNDDGMVDATKGETVREGEKERNGERGRGEPLVRREELPLAGFPQEVL